MFVHSAVSIKFLIQHTDSQWLFIFWYLRGLWVHSLNLQALKMETAFLQHYIEVWKYSLEELKRRKEPSSVFMQTDCCKAIFNHLSWRTMSLISSESPLLEVCVYMTGTWSGFNAALSVFTSGQRPAAQWGQKSRRPAVWPPVCRLQDFNRPVCGGRGGSTHAWGSLIFPSLLLPVCQEVYSRSLYRQQLQTLLKYK